MSADTSSADTEQAGGDDAPFAKHGKVSYLEIPAADVARSATFYAGVFGWTITHSYPDGQRASFEDASGEMIGAFVAGRAITAESGILPYTYVQAIDKTVAAIEARGCSLMRPVYPEGDLWVTEFRDPAGNVMGVWQKGPR